jgi:hypothetical protein
MTPSLARLRRRASPVSPPVPDVERADDPPGTIRFETAWARRRFIPIEPMGDTVHFVAPSRRHWPGQRHDPMPQLVTRAALPDTVTCGSGYIEVLAFVEGGIVVNEVRTLGDQVIAMADMAL